MTTKTFPKGGDSKRINISSTTFDIVYDNFFFSPLSVPLNLFLFCPFLNKLRRVHSRDISGVKHLMISSIIKALWRVDSF